MTLAELAAPTPAAEIKQRQGPGGKRLDYIDARFVMERLDSAVGPTNWQDRYNALPSGSVECGIGIRLEDGEWVWKWDVGDQSEIEPTKGAYSDSFKRAAVKWGVGRDLYGDHARPSQAAAAPRQAPTPASAPRAASVAASAAPDEGPAITEEDFAGLLAPKQAEFPAFSGEASQCPVHKLPWKEVPAGVSKAGKPYGAFLTCPDFDCREKPRR